MTSDFAQTQATANRSRAVWCTPASRCELDACDQHRYIASVTTSSRTSQSASTTDPASAAQTRTRQLVLASASPRRREILSNAGLRFVIQPSTIEEKTRADESPEALAERLAQEKAVDVAASLIGENPVPVLGADTIVVIDNDVLGKPRDETHAVELLTRLMGRQHRVMTGIALAWSDGREVLSEVVTSQVEMRPATRDELVEYVSLGESLDKAGGYALQGAGQRFVVRVVGSSSNVIGLPLEETLALFERGGALEAIGRE